MYDGWVTAFLVSGAVAIVCTPLMRRLAVAATFVDLPATRKSHETPTPYLGGVALMAASLAGAVVGPAATSKIGVLVLAGAALGLIGLLDDDRTLNPGPRLAAQIGAAVVAVAVGVHADITGMDALDTVLTVVWIVGITNALNLLDNMDGLAGGTALASVTAILMLAALGEQEVVSTLAAATAGACIGFLAFNISPATIFMGDAGSLFLGFVLAIAALEVDPPVGPPGSFVVPLLLLGIPLLDTTTVVIARLRHGRRVGMGGRDHLSHRLVRRGLSRGAAVLVLVLAQAALGAVAVFTGRDVLHPLVGLAAGMAILAAIAASAWSAQVYEEPVVGLPRRIRLAVAGGVAFAVLLVGPPAVALVLARGPLQGGADAASDAVDAARAGEPEEAERLFTLASRRFATARDRLDGPLARIGAVVPVVAPNLDALRELAGVGTDVATSGATLTRAVESDALKLGAGIVPINEAERLAPTLAATADVLRDALDRAEAVTDPYLLPPVENAATELVEQLSDAIADTDDAHLAARLSPAIFGGDGSRRYFLAIENNAEARATGGFIGNWGILTATNGEIDLESVQRISVLNEGGSQERHLTAPVDFLNRYSRFDITRTWQNVNMSPDFPTVGAVIAELYPQSGGEPVDGVISIDPAGLAHLLELSGPVTVEGWPEPITAENVVEVTLSQAYEAFDETSARADFLGLVAEEAWRGVIDGELGSPANVARTLGRAAREGHLKVWFAEEEEQELAERVGIAKAMPPVRGDSLALISQNAAGNKTDYFLHRDIRYQAEITPLVDRPPLAAVDARVEVTLVNNSPGGGLSPTVIGPYDQRFLPGENRSFTSLYSPLAFDGATLDGSATTLESERELERNVYSTFVSLAPGAHKTLSVDLGGETRLGTGGWYALDLVHQPLLNDDEVEVRLSVARGWRIADTIDIEKVDRRTATWSGAVTRDHTLWLRIEVDRLRSLWDRLRGPDDPFTPAPLVPN